MEHPKHPSTDKLINIMWYIQRVIYCLAIKGNGLLISVTIGIILEKLCTMKCVLQKDKFVVYEIYLSKYVIVIRIK